MYSKRIRFDEGELEIGHDCDTGTLTDERVRKGEHKLQPEATTPALYSTYISLKLLKIWTTNISVVNWMPNSRKE